MVAVPQSINDALNYLKTERKLERELACNYLAMDENFDAGRRVEVCDALLSVHAYEAASALHQWVDVTTIPRLKEELSRSEKSIRFQPLLEAYASIAGVEAAPLLATRLRDESTKRILKEIGPQAGPSVLPYMNSSNLTERAISRDLLAQWNTDGNLLIRQCLEDSDSPNVNKSKPAMKFMVEYSGQVESDLQNEIAQKYETLLADPDYSDRSQVVELLGRYPGEDTAALLVEFMKSYKRSARMDHVVVKALSNLDSEVAIDGIVFAFLDGRSTPTSTEALLSKNSPRVAKKLVEQFDNCSPRARSLAIPILEKVDGGNLVLVEKCTQYLNSDDIEEIKSGMNLLRKCEHDTSYQLKVSQALSSAIDSIPASTEDVALLHSTSVVAKLWGDGEVASRLVGFVDSPNSKISKRILSTLGEMKEPVTYPVFVKQLFNKEKRNRASQTILRFGNSAEAALLEQIDNPALSDKKTSQTFFSLLGRIGGNKTLEVLQRRVAEIDDTMIEKAMKSAIRAIERKPGTSNRDQ